MKRLLGARADRFPFVGLRGVRLLAAVWLAAATTAWASPPVLNLAPASIPWNTNTFVAFNLSGIAAGATVNLSLWADIAHTGVVDTNADVLLMEFRLQDGVSNSLAARTVVCDTDGAANGSIQGQISYHGRTDEAQLWHAYGAYVWQASYTDGTPIASAPFTIQEPTGGIWITGSVQVVTSLLPLQGSPLGGAVLFLQQYSAIGSYAPSVWTDTNGCFTLHLASSITTGNVAQIMAAKPGYFAASTGPDEGTPLSVHSFTQPLHPGTNALAGPLLLVPAYPGMVATLSGTVTDDSGKALPGVLLIAEEPSSDSQDLGLAISDANGAFAMVWPQFGGTVQLISGTAALNMRGLVGAALQVGPVTTDVSGLHMVCPIATTLVTGKVRSELNNGMAGIKVEVGSDILGASVFTFSSNGNFEACLTGGSDFYASVTTETLQPKLRICPTNTLGPLTIPASGIDDIFGFQTLPGFVISGHVYDQSTTNPLTGGQVWAQIPNNGFGRVDEEPVNVMGLYQLLVPSGEYTVGTYQYGNAGYIDQTWPTNILVGSGSVGGIDFYLSPGGFIQGQVLGNGVPMTNAFVGVGVVSSSFWMFVAGAPTDSNGNYSVTMPPGSNYLVKANGPNNSPWLEQFYSNAVSFAGATSVTVQAGVPTAGIDFNLSVGAQVSGQVLGNGAPLPHAGVEVGVVISNNWIFVAGSMADSNGNYCVTVPPGSNYIVKADGPNGSLWLEQFYSNVGSFIGATPVTALSGVPTAGIDFNLAAGAQVSGQVLGNGAPLPHAGVEVGVVVSNNWTFVAGSMADSNGNYFMTVPPGSNYIVKADGPNGSPWLEQFYSHVGSFIGATPVTALSGAPAAGINFNLSAGAQVMGHVFGHGATLAGVSVEVGTVLTNSGSGWSWQETHYGMTDSNGIYAITLPPGSNYYAFVAQPPESIWLSQFYLGAVDISGATSFATQTNAPATVIDFDLLQRTQISGTVLGNGTPLAGARVSVGSLFASLWQFLANTTTDTNGFYGLTVPPGTAYVVKAEGPNGTTWAEQFYNLASNALAATPVSALDGAPAANVNFNLSAPSFGILSLQSGSNTLAAALGAGVASADVLAQLDAADTTGLTFVPALVGEYGTATPVPPGAPVGTSIVNLPPGDGESGFFRLTFLLPPDFANVQLSGSANADDYGRVFLNGHPLTPAIASSDPGRINEFGNVAVLTQNPAWFTAGTNVILVADANSGGPSGAAFFFEVTYQRGTLPVQLRSPAMQPGGPFRFSFSATPGRQYRIWSSTNLLLTNGWTLLVTSNAAAGSFDFADPDVAGHPQRFYKGEEVPAP